MTNTAPEIDKCYKTIYEKPKASIQIIKNAKRNRYQQTNEH